MYVLNIVLVSFQDDFSKLFFIRSVFSCIQHGVTPIIWAAGRGHSGVVAALLTSGAKVNSADKVSTFLHLLHPPVSFSPSIS